MDRNRQIGFFDRIVEIVSVNEELKPAQRFKCASYNALDFRASKYWPEGITLKDEARKLSALAVRAQTPGVITLGTLKEFFWRYDESPQEVVRYVDRMPGITASLQASILPLVCHSSRTPILERECLLPWSRHPSFPSSYQLDWGDLVQEFGSRELIAYILGVGCRVFFKDEPADRLDPMRSLYRPIELSERALSSDWLNDPEQGQFDEKTVLFEKADEILFSIEKMSGDPRLSADVKVITGATQGRRKPTTELRNRIIIGHYITLHKKRHPGESLKRLKRHDKKVMKDLLEWAKSEFPHLASSTIQKRIITFARIRAHLRE